MLSCDYVSSHLGCQDNYPMSITPFQALACPLDGTPLHCTGSTWRCASGHSFDIASQQS